MWDGVEHARVQHDRRSPGRCGPDERFTSTTTGIPSESTKRCSRFHAGLPPEVLGLSLRRELALPSPVVLPAKSAGSWREPAEERSALVRPLAQDQELALTDQKCSVVTHADLRAPAGRVSIQPVAAHTREPRAVSPAADSALWHRPRSAAVGGLRAQTPTAGSPRGLATESRTWE